MRGASNWPPRTVTARERSHIFSVSIVNHVWNAKAVLTVMVVATSSGQQAFI
jgi:hypothetical protein